MTAGKGAAPAAKTAKSESKPASSESKVAGSEDAKKIQDRASADDAELEKLDQEEKQNWSTERQYWLKG